MTQVQEPVSDERTWAMLAHLVTFSGVVVPLGNLFAPVVVGLVKRESAYVRYHARSALMFQLSFLLYEAVSVLLALAVIGGIRNGALEWSLLLQVMLVLLALYALAVLIGWVGLVLHAAIRARAGVLYQYPFVLRFLK